MSKRNKKEKHTNLYLIMRDEKTSKSHNDIQNIKKNNKFSTKNCVRKVDSVAYHFPIIGAERMSAEKE